MEGRPPALRSGDPVRVVAPSGPVDVERFHAGVRWLRGRYEVTVGPEVYERHRFTAGRLPQRQAALDDALADPAAAAVFCARGGDGALHLLPRLRLAESSPKLVVGFSDITALHLAWQSAGRTSVHGPIVSQLGAMDADVEGRLLGILEAPEPPAAIRGTAALTGGRVRGRLVGGNLAIVAALVGTPFLPALDGAVLLLEDVGEAPYRVDRMWLQLRFAGVFERVAGIVLGEFTNCDARDGDHTASEVLADLAREEGLPCAAGFAIGHGAVNLPVPLGVACELDADAATLRFLEAAVR